MSDTEDLSPEKEKNKKECVIWVYSFIDLMAPIGKKLNVFGFSTEEEALEADKEWEFTINKMKEITDRKLAPVSFKNGWEEYSHFRKRLLKEAKRSDKKTKKNLDAARKKDRAERLSY